MGEQIAKEYIFENKDEDKDKKRVDALLSITLIP